MNRKARDLAPTRIRSGKQRGANRQIVAQGQSTEGLGEWLRAFRVAHAHTVSGLAGTIDARVPDDQREQFALALLARALALIVKRSKYRPISWLMLSDGDPLRQFEYLIACFEPRRSGRRHKPKRPRGKRGAPIKWSEDYYAALAAFTRNGRADLKARGATKISNKEALAEGMRALWRVRRYSEHEVRQFVEKHRRRIARSERRLGPAPKNPG